ncbi:hypothetical protein TYRP_009435 [Tyrophagus putrescentiae]|nr:hypothetical protein TYRP_009435 [Tyrophagus putrescentiae]
MNTSLVDCGLGNNYVLYVYDLDSTISLSCKLAGSTSFDEE